MEISDDFLQLGGGIVWKNYCLESYNLVSFWAASAYRTASFLLNALYTYGLKTGYL